MTYLFVALALAGLFLFLFLSPKTKVLVSFLLMMSLFDCVPNVMFGYFVWDAGIALLFFSWVHLTLTGESSYVYTDPHVRLLKVFVCWMLFCLAWSLVIYQYPLMLTMKASRQLILGYVSFFILLRLFEEKGDSLQFLLKAFYWLSYLLLTVGMVQYALKVEILFGLIKEYDGVLRALPIFLPFSHLFMWYILSRYLAARQTSLHEMVYVVLTLVATLTTFTRGIYLAILLSGLFILLVMLLQGRLVLVRAVSALCVCILGLALLFTTTDILEKSMGRFASALTLMGEANRQVKKSADDTYTGRIGLMKERLDAVANKNPLVGFGFMHEDIYEKQRLPFRYGSVIYTPKYLKRYAYGHPYALALHSADVGWQNLAIDTGLVGFALFLSILLATFVRYFATSGLVAPDDYFLRLAFFVQIFTLAILMFNGNTYTNNVHIPAFMLAAFTWLTHRSRGEEPAAEENAGTNLIPVRAGQPC